MSTRERATAAAPELVIVRIFDAPRDLLWKAWNDPHHAKQWGPRGFTTPEREFDPRPGGKWHARMISPEGREYRQHGVVREYVPPERMSFTFIWDDTPDVEMLVSVSFVERGGKTEMTFRQTGFESVASRDGHEGGWMEAFDRLEDVIATL